MYNMFFRMFFITFIVYYLIGTFILINILFNPQIRLKYVSRKDGKEIEPPLYLFIIIAIWWIVLLPIMIQKGKEDE